MAQTPEATVTVPVKGVCQFELHMHDFFKKWMQNYSKPFTIGDEYPIELILTFDTIFEVKSSTKKDPVFTPKTYDGRVDHTNGDPYIGVTSTNPESTIQVCIKRMIMLTNAMIP